MERLWENASTVSLRRGDAVFRAGERVTAVYRLLGGRLDMYQRLAGKSQEPLYPIHAGECLIEAAFGRIHDASAFCTTPGKLQRLFITRFHALLRNDSALALALCQHFARGIADLRQACQHHNSHFAPLRERILDYVATHADPASGILELPYSQSLWARELGVAEETLSRTLRQLRQDGLLEKPSGCAFRCLRGAT